MVFKTYLGILILVFFYLFGSRNCFIPTSVRVLEKEKHCVSVKCALSFDQHFFTNCFTNINYK